MTFEDFDKFGAESNNYALFVSYWLKDTLREMIRVCNRPRKNKPAWLLEMEANAAEIPMVQASAFALGMEPEQVVSTLWETANRMKLERLNKKTAEIQDYRKAA